MTSGVRAVAIAVVLLAAAVAASASAAPAAAQSQHLLDVPYIQQSEALCGGAAVAMVMRYWGATGVYAETFAPLVDRSAAGIRGESLLAALRERGWDARSFRGDAALVQQRLAARQPVIALIEDRPGAFHYVVVVAWTADGVIVHDPARSPFRVLSQAAFASAWDKSSRWTLLALPPGKGPDPVSDPQGVRPLKGSGPVAATSGGRVGSGDGSAVVACRAMVDEAVSVASAGDYDKSSGLLKRAADACPREAAPWREMAGVHAVRGEWTLAAARARDAISRDATDAHAWRILATSSFVAGDSHGALAAWNRIGEPTIDLVTVHGLRNTRHAAATDVMGLAPRTLLTPEGLAAANRRLDELPAAELARVTYRPLENGRTSVDAVVVERPRAPATLMSAATIGARMLTDRELRLWTSNLTGSGDMLTATWRWWDNRPRYALSYALPVPFGGILTTDVFYDEQTYARDASDPFAERRKGGMVSLADWTRTGLRWNAGLGVDAWRGRGRTGLLSLGVEQRLAQDRVSLRANTNALAGSFTSWTTGIGADWRSRVRHEGQVALLRGGLEFAGSEAPLALWPGAGTGQARPILLRAHPLVEDGVVSGDVFGRRVAHASGEWRRWFKSGLRIVPLAPAAFIDLAGADRRLRPGSAWHADAGVGMRIAIPGGQVLRVDIAKGLRDGATSFSVGWTR